jgi:hypothetical protein
LYQIGFNIHLSPRYNAVMSEKTPTALIVPKPGMARAPAFACERCRRS